MIKLDKDLYIKHAKRLSVIINPQSQFARYLTKPEFIKGIKLQLNILAVLEKRFAKDAKCDVKVNDLVKAFNELTKTEFEIDKKFKLDDDGDYIDAINYLHTYCKNIFKVDLDELAEGKTVTVKEPELNIGKEARADEAGASEPEGNPFMGAFAGMAGMGGMGEDMMNPFLYAQATNKLNNQVITGEVYQYKSKPKLIPIIKMILTVLSFLIAVAFIVSSVFIFITNGLGFRVEGADKNLSTITNGVFYLITAGFAIYTGVTGIQQIVAGKKNDNQKYSFTWFFYFIVILLCLFMTLIDIRNTWAFPYEITSKEATNYKVGFTGWKIMLFVDIGLAAIMLIPTIIGGVKAPKVDGDRMTNLLKQYMNEMNPMKPMGDKADGVDVQKPVDVKPSKEDKKKDDKEDDKPLKS